MFTLVRHNYNIMANHERNRTSTPDDEESPLEEQQDEEIYLSPEMLEFARVIGEASSQATVAALTGRRVSRGEPSSQTSEPEVTAVTPENFSKRTASHREQSGQIVTDQQRSKFDEKVKNKNKRERLDTLQGIAETLAKRLNYKAKMEEQERAEEIAKAKESDKARPEMRYAPETVVEHTWHDRRRRILPWDHTPSVTRTYVHSYIDGWVITRTASIMNKRPIVQEVLLGVDGKLYAYATDDQRNISKLLENPHTRKEIQELDEGVHPPRRRRLSTLPLPPKVRHDERTSQEPKNIYSLADEKYPLPGVGGGHIFAEPKAIQQGLEELAAEKNIMNIRVAT